MTDPNAKEIDLPASLHATLARIITEHGDEAAKLAMVTFMLPAVPLAAAMVEAGAINKLGIDLGLSPQQMNDGVQLIACCIGAENPHRAWLAAEILLRTIPPAGLSNLLAALGPTANSVVA